MNQQFTPFTTNHESGGNQQIQFTSVVDNPVLPIVKKTLESYDLETQLVEGFAETVLVDPSSRTNQAIQAMFSTAKLGPKRKIKKREIHLHGRYTDSQKSTLQNYASPFDVRFMTNSRFHNHDMADAVRSIELEKILAISGHGKPYIDIGGNYYRHARRNNKCHSCCPVLGDIDSSRYKNRELMALEDGNNPNYKGSVLKEHYEKKKYSDIVISGQYQDSITPLRCFRRAEECPIKADVAFSIHAAYDIPKANWASIMSRREIDVVYGALIHSPRVTKERKGYIPAVDCHFFPP